MDNGSSSSLYGNALVLRFLDTFKEFPPRAEPASFTISAAVEKMKKAIGVGGRLSLAGLGLLARRADEVGDRRLRRPRHHRGPGFR